MEKGNKDHGTHAWGGGAGESRDQDPNRRGRGQDAAALEEFLIIGGQRGVISMNGYLEWDSTLKAVQVLLWAAILVDVSQGQVYRNSVCFSDLRAQGPQQIKPCHKGSSYLMFPQRFLFKQRKQESSSMALYRQEGKWPHTRGP